MDCNKQKLGLIHDQVELLKEIHELDISIHNRDKLIQEKCKQFQEQREKLNTLERIESFSPDNNN